MGKKIDADAFLRHMVEYGRSLNEDGRMRHWGDFKVWFVQGTEILKLLEEEPAVEDE